MNAKRKAEEEADYPNKSVHQERVVVLLGKVGHGKSRICNLLCGTAFASTAATKSCTRAVQEGITPNEKICVLDTPGFYSSEDVALHISEQQCAIESRLLSGVYVVVRIGRADEIAQSANQVMDFVGDDDVRLIITFADTVSHEENNFEPSELKTVLNELLDISEDNIFLTGSETTSDEVEQFLASTLHSPRQFRIEKEQLAYAASFTDSTKKFEKLLGELNKKLRLADGTSLYIRKQCVPSEDKRKVIAAIEREVAALVSRGLPELRKIEQDLTPSKQVAAHSASEIAQLEMRTKCCALRRPEPKGVKPTNDIFRPTFVEDGSGGWWMEFSIENDENITTEDLVKILGEKRTVKGAEIEHEADQGHVSMAPSSSAQIERDARCSCLLIVRNTFSYLFTYLLSPRKEKEE